MQGFITGWKSIARFLDVSVKTAKTYHYRYKMPILRITDNSSPHIIPNEVIEWLSEFDRIRKERKKG